MSSSIDKVAILGAGVMGSQIAAHFANAGIPSYLLDIVPAEENQDRTARGKIAREGLARLRKIKPSPFFLPELSDFITPGNFEDDLSALSEVDWVVEAVVENLDVKRELLKKIQPVLKAGTVISSNTSGIRISEIAEGMSPDFRRHFLGTHFFNPPRYTKLLEIIPGPDTLPEVLERIALFGREVLGKGVIRCKDTPNFIANRIGTFAICHILHLMLEKGYTIEEVDLLTGPLTGKPRSATFRTLDLVGIDTFIHVANNVFQSAPEDEMRSFFKIPDFVTRLVEKKWLGEKTGQGFYKRVRREDGGTDIFVLDLNTMEYRPRQNPKLPSADMAGAAESFQERLRILLSAKDKAGEFVRKTTAALFAYASNRVPEISDSFPDVDRAMKWGFVWENGPFELWDLVGIERAAEWILQEHFQIAPWVLRMMKEGKKSFYRDGEPIQPDPKAIDLGRLKKSRERVVAENAGAGLLDLGDRVLCLEFHTKMNALGDDILGMADVGLDKLANDYDALVIGNQGENFSVGANLMLILMLAQEEEWEELEGAIKRFQSFNMRMKYFSKPVVAAPHGKALGGGCEIVLHAPVACASVESYLGLVEVGAGLIPAGGGTKEMVLRAQRAQRAQERGKQTKPAQAISEAFQTIAFAKVSTSGFEAKKIGYLRDNTSFVMNRDYLLHEAKKLALSMIEKRASLFPGKMTAFGKALNDSLVSFVEGLRSADKISEYDAHLGRKLAKVMSGGDAASSQEVSEQHFLDLEREAFLSLCGERKTQERMQHLLKTGKPLRN